MGGQADTCYIITKFYRVKEHQLDSKDEIVTMARGQQKIQSQQKNAEKLAKIKKAESGDSKKAAAAALVFKCSVCMTQMPDPKTYKQHFENKHPKSPLPAELASV